MNEKADILEELSNLSEVLQKMKLEQEDYNLKVTEGYFENLEHCVMKKIEDENNAINESIPIGYFERLEANVFERIKDLNDNNESPKGKLIDFSKSRNREPLSYRPLLVKIAIAATLFFFFIRGTSYFKSTEEPEKDYLANVTKSEAISYIDENISDFTTEQIIEIHKPETLAALETVTADEIKAYLNQNLDQIQDEDLVDIF